MQIDLTGKTALVTASSKGIGYAAAAGLHAAGATVVVNGRTAEGVDEAVDSLGGGDRVRGIAADVGTAAGCEKVVEAEPRVDILVNNAGVGVPQPVLEVADAEWERLFSINVMSGVRLSRSYLPGMQEAGWGRILFVSSESALNIPTEMVPYGVTKLAQLGVARGLAESVPGSGVTINSVVPGPTLTAGFEAFMDDNLGKGWSVEEVNKLVTEKVRPTSLLGRLATSEEVANLIVYLASPQASATTGAAVRVDGGVVRTVV